MPCVPNYQSSKSLQGRNALSNDTPTDKVGISLS